MRAFYTDRLGDVGDFTFVIAGNTTDAALQPLVERYLGSLPGSQRADGARESDVHLRPGVTRVRVRRGLGQLAQVRLMFHGEEPLAPGAGRELETLRSYLDIRLREALRQELGAVYHVETWSALREPPQQGYELGLRFDCPKDRSGELKGVVLGVLAELRKGRVEQGHLDALREQRARALEGAERSGELWLEALADAYRRGNDPTQVVAERMEPARLSSAALSGARRYLRAERHLDALLEPEAGAGH